jgi:hypothetical protein
MEVPSMEVARYYRLATDADVGVRCDGGGLFIGATPLLERAPNRNELPVWRPRPLADVNRDLSQSYGMPIALAALGACKSTGLPTIFGPGVVGVQ